MNRRIGYIEIGGKKFPVVTFDINFISEHCINNGCGGDNCKSDRCVCDCHWKYFDAENLK